MRRPGSGCDSGPLARSLQRPPGAAAFLGPHEHEPNSEPRSCHADVRPGGHRPASDPAHRWPRAQGHAVLIPGRCRCGVDADQVGVVAAGDGVPGAATELVGAAVGATRVDHPVVAVGFAWPSDEPVRSPRSSQRSGRSSPGCRCGAERAIAATAVTARVEIVRRVFIGGECEGFCNANANKVTHDRHTKLRNGHLCSNAVDSEQTGTTASDGPTGPGSRRPGRSVRGRATTSKVAVTDIDGVLRGKYMDKAKFLKSVESGFGFCNVVLGWGHGRRLLRQRQLHRLAHRVPPMQRYASTSAPTGEIPWEDGAADVPRGIRRCAGRAVGPVSASAAQSKPSPLHVMPATSPPSASSSSRFNFTETPRSADAKGYRGLDPISPGMFGYSVLRHSTTRSSSRPSWANSAVPGAARGLHTETGPGVLEAAILHGGAVEAADRAVLFKSAAKEVGARLGVMPTFMARIASDLPGCSGHHHQSLVRIDSGEAAFLRRRRGGLDEFGVPVLPGRPAALPRGPAADAGADGEQLQAAGRGLLGSHPTHLGCGQPDRGTPGDSGWTIVDTPGDPAPRLRRQPLSLHGGVPGTQA